MSASDLLEFDWEDIERELEAAYFPYHYDDYPENRRARVRAAVERILAIHDRATQRIARDRIDEILSSMHQISLDKKSAREHTPRC